MNSDHIQDILNLSTPPMTMILRGDLRRVQQISSIFERCGDLSPHNGLNAIFVNSTGLLALLQSDDLDVTAIEKAVLEAKTLTRAYVEKSLPWVMLDTPIPWDVECLPEAPADLDDEAAYEAWGKAIRAMEAGTFLAHPVARPGALVRLTTGTVYVLGGRVGSVTVDTEFACGVQIAAYVPSSVSPV